MIKLAFSDLKLFILFGRRVQTESATGSVSSNKVRTTLAIAVEGIEFDTQACMLRIKGRNVEENQYVKVGTCLLLFLTKGCFLALQLYRLTT